MIVIPAIDLKDGQCVRLLQGRKDEVTTYSRNPAEMAKRWADEGAELLHVVDLDGAFSGDQKNLKRIEEIRKAVDIDIEVGGGIRDMRRIEYLIQSGINRVILGTSAVKDPDFVREATERYPGRILVGIDARDGRVAIKGWVEVTGIDAMGFAKEMESLGVAGIIYTDIVRDGMLSGPNIETTEKMVRALNIPVIASGGISSLDDIKRLLTIDGLWGAITGKALYTGTLKLREAIELCRSTAS